MWLVPNENRMPFLYSDSFVITKHVKPVSRSIHGKKIINDGFLKRRGPTKAASKPIITTKVKGS